MHACLLLTRPLGQSRCFAEKMRKAGWRGPMMIAPLMQIDLIPPDPAVLDEADILIVTSQHGVAALNRATTARHWPIWCVGARTAATARAAGFPQVYQAGGDAQALRAALLATAPDGRILHLSGRHVAMDLAAELDSAGVSVTALVVYDQSPLPLSDAAHDLLAGEARDVVLPLFSPRSARLMSAALDGIGRVTARVHLLALSDAVAEACHGVGATSLRVAMRPDAEAMCSLIIEAQAELEPCEKPR